MARLLFIVLVFCPWACCAGLPSFDLKRTAQRHAELFSLDDVNSLAESPAPGSGKPAAPTADKFVGSPRRQIDEWFGRGFGLSVVVTGSLIYPGAGVALEACIPLDSHVGLLLRGGIIGNLFFEGSYYDIGPRGYFDISPHFTLYVDGGFRLAYGRILGYVGNSLKRNVLHRLGVGGFSDLGLEVGSPKIRFFAEVTFNGAKTLGEEFQVMIFCGLNLGIRFYIGAQ
jgi:hypothetical protein